MSIAVAGCSGVNFTASVITIAEALNRAIERF